MKKLFTLSLVLLGMHTQAQTMYPGFISGCIARYDFNSITSGPVSSLADVSGNGNHSAIVNDLTTTTDFRGRANKAMLFNGSSSSVFVPDAPILNPDLEVSIVALVRSDSFYSGICQLSEIVAKGKQRLTPGHYYLGISDNRADGEDCYAYDATQMQAEHMFGLVFTPQPPGHFVPAHTWYFIAATYNGQETNIYAVPMDPQMKLEGIAPYFIAPAGGNMGINTDPLTIGLHDMQLYPYWFNGAMDEVALFNRGLSNTEVYQVYSYLWGATLSVEGSGLLNDITAYPNPASNNITIAGSIAGAGSIQMEVYNAMGQRLMAEHIAAGNGILQHKLNTANLPAGLYNIRLNAAGISRSINISIQR